MWNSVFQNEKFWDSICIIHIVIPCCCCCFRNLNTKPLRTQFPVKCKYTDSTYLWKRLTYKRMLEATIILKWMKIVLPLGAATAQPFQGFHVETSLLRRKGRGILRVVPLNGWLGGRAGHGNRFPTLVETMRILHSFAGIWDGSVGLRNWGTCCCNDKFRTSK